MYQVKVTSEKQTYNKVESKCGSKDNIKHKPSGGDKKVVWSYGFSYISTYEILTAIDPIMPEFLFNMFNIGNLVFF